MNAKANNGKKPPLTCKAFVGRLFWISRTSQKI